MREGRIRRVKARRVPGVMNKTETEYEKLFLGKLPHGYEEITLRLGPDCRFTPDFWVQEKDDVLAFHEVKGGHIRGDAIVKLRVAAERYPWFRFKMFQLVKGTWSVTHFGEKDAA